MIDCHIHLERGPYGKDCELRMNMIMLKEPLAKGVKILTASDAHSPNDVGANIIE
jgi:histidinol phosphatase-like PHP family hydrolase